MHTLMRNNHYKIISSFLRKETCKAELSFVISSAEVFQKSTETFQRREPLVHLLYEELYKVCYTVLCRVLKQPSLII